MTKIYKNPPLAEAVFELFYKPENWNAAIPGMFYEKIKSDYPNIGQAKGGFGLTMGNQGFQFGSGNSDIVQFRNSDNNKILQLANNIFTVNRVPIYNGWDKYSETINKGVSTFKDVVNPKVIQRIGLKFVNKIDIGENRTIQNFKNHFKCYPVIEYPTENNLSAINYTVEIPIKEKEVFAITVATLGNEPKMKTPILFQLYYTRMNPIEFDKIKDWVENAHKILKKAFEDNLTDQCKEKWL